MAKYQVHYSGWYIVEAESAADALGTDRDDGIYQEWENEDSVFVED